MIYEASEISRGDPGRAIEFLTTTLTGAGFRIDSRTNSTLVVSRASLFAAQNQALLASKIEFTIGGGTISARSELKPPTLIFSIVIVAELISMVVLFVVLNHAVAQPGHAPIPRMLRQWLPLTPLAPLIVILPALYFSRKTMHKKTVDTLVHNAASVSA